MNPDDASAVPLPGIAGKGTAEWDSGRHTGTSPGCDSTNTRARELAAAGAPHGTVVTADEQTEGRGRQGRSWSAPAGKALLYSAILRPLGERPLLPLAAGLAVCEAAEELADPRQPTASRVNARSSGPTTSSSKGASWPES